MLRDLDKRLIEKEMKIHNVAFADEIEFLTVEFVKKLLKDYDVLELTTHYYDSDPYECEVCSYWEDEESELCCHNCPYYIDWMKNDEVRLRNVTWIDVEGPGIWDMTQEKCNSIASEVLKNAYWGLIFPEHNIDYTSRVWKIESPSADLIDIYIYLRDVKGYDTWIVFKKKG